MVGHLSGGSDSAVCAVQNLPALLLTPAFANTHPGRAQLGTTPVEGLLPSV